MSEIVFHSGNTSVGSIIFDEHPQYLYAERTATGFNLEIPAKIGLKPNTSDQPQLTISNMRLVLSVENDSEVLEVGRLHHDGYHSAFITDSDPVVKMTRWELIWSSTLPALLAIESYRKGEAPRLRVTLKAELCHAIMCEQWQNHGRTPRQRFRVLTAPERISERTNITYPDGVWEAMVRKLLAESWDDPFLTLLPLRSLLGPKM